MSAGRIHQHGDQMMQEDDFEPVSDEDKVLFARLMFLYRCSRRKYPHRVAKLSLPVIRDIWQNAKQAVDYYGMR